MTTRVKHNPNRATARRPVASTVRMASIFRWPQYWATSTQQPMAKPLQMV